MMIRNERVLLGHVGVDSGTLVITDPCYLDNERLLDQAIKASDSKHEFHAGESQGIGTSVAFQPGIGDGYYPVFAVYDEAHRIVRLEMMFIGDEQLGVVGEMSD